jgi:hypothetical protein
MAKKAISGGKKTKTTGTQAKKQAKKQASGAKKPAPGKALKPSGAKAAARTKPPARKAAAHNGIEEQAIALLPPGLMDGIKNGVNTLMETFEEVSQEHLNALQRRRKVGAGIKIYGLIEKVADLAEANPQFAQFFSPQDLRNCLTNFDNLRDIALLLQSFTRLVTNTMMVYSNTGYGMTLIFYNMVKEMSRRGNPTAMELFRALSPFFHRAKRVSAQPTIKQSEKDMHAFLTGKKNGFFGVENFSPKLTGGKRKIIDKKFSDSEEFKENEEGEFRE